MQKKTNYIILGFALCLLQVWLPSYFVTGDGPCHVYNAQVLHDFWEGKNTDFFARFYTVVYKPNPNWLSTAVLAALMYVVNGVIAEKIFLSLYVLLFTGGFYLLLRKISGNASWWPLVLFVFVFTHPLFKGFYNFSFSIAFYFWVVWSWLRFLEKNSPANAALFFFFTGLAFFTHLLAFVFAAFTCGALVGSYSLAANFSASRTRFFIRHSFSLLLLLAPFIILMRWFTEKEGGMRIQLCHHFRRLIELVQFRYIVNITHGEDYFAAVTGVALIALFIAALMKYRQVFSIHKYDGFLFTLAFVSFVYLFFPEDFLGRLILITLRVQLFVFIVMACCIAYMLPSQKLKNIGGMVLFVAFIALSLARIPCQLAVSRGAADYVSGVSLIKPYSVVLPLDFFPNGKDPKGNMLADRNWLFCHAAQYLGTFKPLIVLDNYEANMGYFPISWKNSVNPYNLLSQDEGIEGQPPFASIAQYKQNTAVTIDYILKRCHDKF